MFRLILAGVFVGTSCTPPFEPCSTDTTCHLLVGSGKSWQDAKSDCNGLNSTLASIGTATEKDCIGRLTVSGGRDAGDRWLGCRYDHGPMGPGRWKCLNASDVFAPATYTIPYDQSKYMQLLHYVKWPM